MASFLESVGIPFTQDHIDTGTQPDFHAFTFTVGESPIVVYVENVAFSHRSDDCESEWIQRVSAALRVRHRGVSVVWIRFNPRAYSIDGVVKNTPLEERHALLLEQIEALDVDILPFPRGVSVMNVYQDQGGKKRKRDQRDRASERRKERGKGRSKKKSKRLDGTSSVSSSTAVRETEP